MKKLLLGVSIASVLGLAGCGGDESIADIKQQVEDAGGVQQPASRIIFDPSGGNLSVPNDLLFSGTNDGTLVMPKETDDDGNLIDSPDYVDPETAIGGLDGWSTTSAFAIEVAMGVTDATVSGDALAQAVHLFEANLGGSLSPVTACKPLDSLSLCNIVSELTYGVDFVAQASGNQIAIVPRKPLQAAHGYLLVLTNQIEDSEGNSLRGSSTYETVSTDVDEAPLPLPSQLSLQKIINSYEDGAAAFVNKDDIIYTAGFTTQSVADVFETTKLLMLNPPAGTDYAPSISTPTATGAVVAALADHYVATLTLPIYGECSMSACMDGATPLINSRWKAAGDSPVAVSLALGASLLGSTADDALSAANFATQASLYGLSTSVTDALTNPASLVGFPWTLNGGAVADSTKHLTRFNPIPAVVRTENVPVQITLPKTSKPAAGWPVVIAMHGLGQGKESALAYADAYAAKGIATIAIDMPLHGERSFGLGVDGAYAITASADSFGESIGKDDAFNNGDILAFINIASPLTVRDNFRQAILDNLALRFSLNSLAGTFDVSKISLQGLSLGAIVGTSVARYSNSGLVHPATQAVLPNYYAITDASLVAPAGGLAGSFYGSASFGPVLFENIKQNSTFIDLVTAANTEGYTAGSAEYDALVLGVYAKFIPSFAFAIQTAVDSIDPLNSASTLAAASLPVQVIEVVGDGSNLADQVLPNRVTGFPLSGTEPLIDYLGLDDTKCVSTGTVAGSGVVRFIKGHHSSLVNPAEEAGVTDGFAAQATAAMQAQVATFADTGNIVISDDTLVKGC